MTGSERLARAPVEVDDGEFSAAFRNMELALAAWPSLPADSHDPLKVAAKTALMTCFL